jgi:hypothetical protein
MSKSGVLGAESREGTQLALGAAIRVKALGVRCERERAGSAVVVGNPAQQKGKVGILRLF